ncbi:MAG: hypothetical protein ABGZ53_20480 [Fuerstiella sp.]
MHPYGNRYGITVKSDGNTIGGTTDADRNIISGNTSNSDSYGIGFWQDADNNDVYRNYIGVGSDGTTAIGNEAGITFQGTGSGNKIGIESAAQGNIIAHSDTDGIAVLSSSSINNSINRNSMFSNAGLGIDLGTSGVTANDTGDGDSGANRLQNFPVLASAVTTGSQITITGTLNSAASTSYRIEFYANSSGDGTGYGEGQTFLGVSDVTTNGSGNASFSPVLTANVAGGSAISATVSRLDGGDAAVETSEFAQNVIATTTGGQPNQSLPGPQNVNEDQILTFSSGNANAVTVSDNGPADTRLQVFLSVNDGVLNLSQTIGLSIPGGANGSECVS